MDDLANYEVRCDRCGNASTIGFLESWGPTRWRLQHSIPRDWLVCDRPDCGGTLLIDDGPTDA